MFKMFDFRRAAGFCLGYRFSKHKMTRFAKNWVACPPGPLGYAHGRYATKICL